MKTVLFATALCAAIASAGGATLTDAHDTHEVNYYNIVIDVSDYERTEYAGFDLVRMNVSVENLAGFEMVSPEFHLGGAAQYVDDPLANPNTDIKSSYMHASYVDVRTRGGSVAVEDCASVDRFSGIPHLSTGDTSLCFMIGKHMVPDGLLVQHGIAHYPDHWIYATDLYPSHHNGECGSDSHGKHERNWYPHSDSHICIDSLKRQVVPFNDDSVYCVDQNFEWCNVDNVQYVDGAPTPPAPEEPESESVELLHALYNNHTGTLTLVFDQPVVARNPDRILMIHDIDAFLEDGDAPNLGDAELDTADGKRQSAVLAFTLPDAMRQDVAQSLSGHGDMALEFGERAVYLAESFVPMQPMRVSDIMVVR